MDAFIGCWCLWHDSRFSVFRDIFLKVDTFVKDVTCFAFLDLLIYLEKTFVKLSIECNQSFIWFISYIDQGWLHYSFMYICMNFSLRFSEESTYIGCNTKKQGEVVSDNVKGYTNTICLS